MSSEGEVTGRIEGRMRDDHESFRLFKTTSATASSKHTRCFRANACPFI